MHFESPSYQRMLKARVVAVKELLTPPLGPRAGLKEGAGDAIYKKTHHQRVPTNRLPAQRGTKRGNSGHVDFQC